MSSEVLEYILNTVAILNNDEEPSQHGFIVLIDQSQFKKKIQKSRRRTRIQQIYNQHLKLFQNQGNLKSIAMLENNKYIEDYLQHNESTSQKLKFRKNKVSNLIHSLADEFQKNRSITQNTPTLHSNSDRCSFFSSIQDNCIEHHQRTQQEPLTFKKIKLNEDINAFNKMGNSLVNSSNQSFKINMKVVSLKKQL